jgi:hypothetical protein
MMLIPVIIKCDAHGCEKRVTIEMKLVETDRGKLRIDPRSYKTPDDWSEAFQSTYCPEHKDTWDRP